MNRDRDVRLVIQIHQVGLNMLENIITKKLMRLVLITKDTVVHTTRNIPWLIRADELSDE